MNIIRKVTSMQVYAVLLAVAMSVVAPAWGQSNVTSYINGQVTSSSGPVSDALITARNVNTGLVRSQTTSADGRYRISALPIGTYVVTARAGNNEGSSAETPVNVGEGASVNLVLAAEGEVLDEITTVGQAIETLNMTETETTTVITTLDLGRLPIPRDANAVALLAPGAVYGDDGFGHDSQATDQHYGTGYGLASIGGASVGENTYYINGLNVTNFRNGLGGSTVPFQFYDQFQIKSGGYSAEFGRSTGGVVNAATKRGTNEWQFGVGVNFEPESLRQHSPDVADPNAPDEFEVMNSKDERNETEAFIDFGGPIIRDKLFVYGIYNARDLEIDNYTAGGEFRTERDDDPFWGVKLDWYITDDHSLEYTGFSDKRTRVRETFNWDEASDTIGTSKGLTNIDRGGDNFIVKYTGTFGDIFTASFLYGEMEYDLTVSSPADATCPVAIDERGGATNNLGCWTSQVPVVADDKREATRADFELLLGDSHVLRFGMDNEDNVSNELSSYSGPNNETFIYEDAVPGDTLSTGGVVPAGVTEVTRHRVLTNGGSFTADTQAFYIEDEWRMTDTMTLRVGVRSEKFDNENSLGETFIKIDDQIAPRIGYSWDVRGDGSSKLFANYGLYHLPIASNTAVRLSSSEFFTEAYHLLDSPIAADGSTVLGAQLGPTQVFGDGEVPPVNETIDLDIEPMFQSEFILGYEQELGDDWIVGIVGTHRDLVEGIEDITLDAALGIPGAFEYRVVNPGRPVRTFVDLGNGSEEVNLTAKGLNFPAVKRKYSAVTLSAEKVWNGEYYFKAQYTWSHSYGNYEGAVRSDNEQDDAGITTLYDFPGLLEGANGNLPQDRPNVLKAWGVWEFRPGWQASGSAQFRSGRPMSAFGLHPSDPFASLYGDESFFNRGVLAPRGSLGRTDNVYNIDVGLKYTLDFNTHPGQLIARLDVFNLFDFDAVTETEERSTLNSGAPRDTFGLPGVYQRARSVRFGLEYNFQ